MRQSEHLEIASGEAQTKQPAQYSNPTSESSNTEGHFFSVLTPYTSRNYSLPLNQIFKRPYFRKGTSRRKRPSETRYIDLIIEVEHCTKVPFGVRHTTCRHNRQTAFNITPVSFLYTFGHLRAREAAELKSRSESLTLFAYPLHTDTELRHSWETESGRRLNKQTQ